MKNILYARVVLGIAAVLGAIVGAYVVAFPHELHEGSGVLLGDDPSLLSEVRAPGGVMLLGVAFLAYAVIRGRVLATAAVLSTVIYLGYALGRVYSGVVDGAPHASLVIAAATEWVVGVLCAVAWWKLRAEVR